MNLFAVILIIKTGYIKEDALFFLRSSFFFFLQNIYWYQSDEKAIAE